MRSAPESSLRGKNFSLFAPIFVREHQRWMPIPSRSALRATNVRTEESKEAERRETRSQPPHPCGVRRAQSAARSPLGVPPRLSAIGSISSQGSTWARLRDTQAEQGG